MLILERRDAEEVVLDEGTRIIIVSTEPDKVTVKVQAQREVCVHRILTQDSLDCEALLVSDRDTVFV
ncbi:MAG: carbon storage regulator [Planctomycetaceae bacterium]|nr:carbon storage regulator [Planctomycetaceae bacterium]